MSNKKTPNQILHHQGNEPHLLKEILRIHQALIAGFSRETGVPASRFLLLRLLATTPEGIGVMDLSRHLSVNAAVVTRQIKELETEGLVSKQANPKDGRRCTLKLSAKGLKQFQSFHSKAHQLEHAMSLAIPLKEIKAAANTLHKLYTFLQTQFAKEY